MKAIHQRRWMPSDAASGAAGGVYLLHGYGEHSGRYTRLAEHLTKQGWIVGSHDHPGHGQSAGRRGTLAIKDEYAQQN